MADVVVLIENAYEDGHESSRRVALTAPADAAAMDEWFEKVVYEHTGDGHGVGKPSLGSCYVATVVAAFDPALIGATYEWTD